MDKKLPMGVFRFTADIRFRAQDTQDARVQLGEYFGNLTNEVSLDTRLDRNLVEGFVDMHEERFHIV